jgi:hypothetical protein
MHCIRSIGQTAIPEGQPICRLRPLNPGWGQRHFGFAELRPYRFAPARHLDINYVIRRKSFVIYIISLYMPMKISPKYTDSKLASGCFLNDKIDVFEDWMNGWMLSHAHALCAPQYILNGESGFAVLTLTAAYFEPIESYYTGQKSHRRSKEFFRKGFLRVFVNLPATLKANGFRDPNQLACDIADEVYDHLRCGLFHEGGTKHKLMIKDSLIPLEFAIETATHDIGGIIISPRRFLAEVQNHLNLYVSALRDPSQTTLRANFESFFDQRISASNLTIMPSAIILP